VSNPRLAVDGMSNRFSTLGRAASIAFRTFWRTGSLVVAGSDS